MRILTLLMIGILATGCVAMPPEVSITVTQPEGAAVALPALADMGARGITSSFSEPAVFEHDVSVAGNLDVTGTATIAGATAWGADMVFEGATADAYETTFAITDPASSDKTITFPNSTGTVALNPYGASIEFEGATANDYELTLTVTDPTADRTLTLPNMTGTVLVASAANKVVFGSNTVTGTLAVTHGLTTPAYALCSMGADPVDNEEDRCTVTISSATVTVKVWKEAGSPTAGDSGVTVYWMVAGTP